MEIKHFHPWDVSPERAFSIQGELRRFTPLDGNHLTGFISLSRVDRVGLVAGVDAAYSRDGWVYAGVVIFSYIEKRIVEGVSASERIRFPYIPGLLSFREIPVILKAMERLKNFPDVLMVDGQGIAHPRRLGIASHLGLCLDLPSIGCAKTRLIGTFDKVGEEKGAFTPLLMGEEIVGVVLRTKKRVKPLFVSPGYKMDLEGGRDLVLAFCQNFRLPEPIRQAHLLACKSRR